MNRAVLIGRLTKDPEIRETQSNIKVASFTLAVDRRYLDSAGNRQADFIPCVAWRGTAEFVEKYLTKGTKVAVEGSIQVRNFEDQNKTRRYITEVICDHVEFCESKARENTQTGNDGFVEVDDGELPF